MTYSDDTADAHRFASLVKIVAVVDSTARRTEPIAAKVRLFGRRLANDYFTV